MDDSIQLLRVGSAKETKGLHTYFQKSELFFSCNGDNPFLFLPSSFYSLAKSGEPLEF